MRHRKDHRKLSRTASHRKALLRNLITSLFQHERIETTVAKAKEARRLGERLITFAKRGDLAARRHVARFVMRPAVTAKLFETIAPWYAERNGGYTRGIRLGGRRGGAGENAHLQLVAAAPARAGPPAPATNREPSPPARRGGASAPGPPAPGGPARAAPRDSAPAASPPGRAPAAPPAPPAPPGLPPLSEVPGDSLAA